MIEDEQFRNAIKRIALTSDGRLLHVFLQRKLMETCQNVALAGALLSLEGERRFALELKALMDSAIAEQPSDAGIPPAERPIVVARPGGVNVSGPIGTRRRVPAAPE